MSQQNSSKILSQSNRHLSNKATARKMRIRSLASNTAIETTESVKEIEAKLTHKRPARYHVTLA